MPPKKPFSVRGPRQGVPGSNVFSSNTESHHVGVLGSNARYRVDELMQGGREAVLVHRGQEYRLRVTSTGKLILTK